MVLRAEGTLRRTCLRERGPERQPAWRPASTAALGLPAARLRCRSAAPLSDHLRDHGADRPGRHVAEPPESPAQLPGAGRRPVRRRRAPPCILIYVDCWTSLAGSQYLDSPGTGKYHSYLCDEVGPW